MLQSLTSVAVTTSSSVPRFLYARMIMSAVRCFSSGVEKGLVLGEYSWTYIILHQMNVLQALLQISNLESVKRYRKRLDLRFSVVWILVNFDELICIKCIVVDLLLWSRQVVSMNFFDIVLDFILMDAFEDLESPPSSVVAVLRNRWLSDSFKETVN